MSPIPTQVAQARRGQRSPCDETQSRVSITPLVLIDGPGQGPLPRDIPLAPREITTIACRMAPPPRNLRDQRPQEENSLAGWFLLGWSRGPIARSPPLIQ